MCIAGTLLPLTQFLPWVFEHGLGPSSFVMELFSTRIGGFFGLDVLVSALVLFVFIFVEGRGLEMRGLWWPLLATLLVGVSLGLPLFLALRQVCLDRQTKIKV